MDDQQVAQVKKQLKDAKLENQACQAQIKLEQEYLKEAENAEEKK